MQAESPNPRMGRRAKAEVLSDAGKGSLTAGQVGDEETNASEPLLTHRKVVTTTPKPGAQLTPGTKVHPSGAPSARRRPVCCPGGVRCRGGVNSSRALARNRRSCAPIVTASLNGRRSRPLAARGRPASGRNHKRQSTDAGRRVGTAHSSDEASVMGVERRSRAGQIDQRSTRKGRS